MSQDLRGRETVPVISLEGAMGVLLYGMATVWKWWMVCLRREDGRWQR
jgi:hypothetical protein